MRKILTIEVKNSINSLKSFCINNNAELIIKSNSVCLTSYIEGNVIIHNIDENELKENVETGLEDFIPNENPEGEDTNNEMTIEDSEGNNTLLDENEKNNEFSDTMSDETDKIDEINSKVVDSDNSRFRKININSFEERNKKEEIVDNLNEINNDEENSKEKLINKKKNNKKKRKRKKRGASSFQTQQKKIRNVAEEIDNSEENGKSFEESNEEMEIEYENNLDKENKIGSPNVEKLDVMEIDSDNDEKSCSQNIEGEDDQFVEKLLNFSNSDIFYNTLPVETMDVEENTLEDIVYNCLLKEIGMFQNKSQLLLYHFRIGYYLTIIQKRVKDKKPHVTDKELSRGIVKGTGIANAYKKNDKYDTKQANRFYHTCLKVFALYSLFSDPITTIYRTADFISRRKLLEMCDDKLNQIREGIYKKNIHNIPQVDNYEEFFIKHSDHLKKYFYENMYFRNEFIDENLINIVILHINNRTLTYEKGNSKYSSIGNVLSFCK